MKQTSGQGTASAIKPELLRILAALCLLVSVLLAIPVAGQATHQGKTLLVVAHPDDEYYFAATVYRMAVQLRGHVDELIITDGEAGFRYSTLAEPYYQKALTTETVGRKNLPSIRRSEALHAGQILGIRHHYFLNQKDQEFTLDAKAGQTSGWNFPYITSKITNLIQAEQYQYLFVILPRSTTHGHHQAAATLALDAVQALPLEHRPLLLGFDTKSEDFTPTPAVSKSQQWDTSFSYSFDRTTHFGFHKALSYQIVVNWMIAEHKSQGLLQTMCDKDPIEFAWINRQGAPDAQNKAEVLFHALDPNVENQKAAN